MQAPNVALQLKEYNQLYEQAFLNEKSTALERERHALEESKQRLQEAFKDKERRLAESRGRAERERRCALTSQNWLLTAHSVEGTHEPGMGQQDGSAAFKCSLEFRVFDAEWTMVPVVDSQMITENWTVQRVSADEIPAGDAEPAWAAVPLVSDTMLVSQEIDGMAARQVLATSVPGLYRISFTAHIFLHSNRNLHAIALTLVHPITAAHLRLKQASDSRLRVRDLSITPAARYSVTEDDGFMCIDMCLPSTKTLEIKWRVVDATDGDWEGMSADGATDCRVTEDDLMQITATHDAIHSIMDGVLQSNHTLKFSIDSEERAFSSVRFTVVGATRVTSVSGHGVASWRAMPTTSEDVGKDLHTSVEVSFRRSLMSDTVILLLNTELELQASSFVIPLVLCENVLRQTGSFAVVKVANVEVHAEETKGVARVGVDELPAELKFQTSLPIMFAYKYLSPQCNVRLRVVTHEQVDVMEAVADSALYEVLVSDGQSMHRLMLNMQNSRKQYLRIHSIPAEARLWSLMVNSRPAKPVRGEDGSLLIPLLVGASGQSNDGAQTASVELAYLLQRDKLGEHGTTTLSPPHLDIPVSKLLMEVQWPEAYDVIFESSANRVSSFSHSVPMPVNHNVGTDIVSAGFDFNRAPPIIPKAGVNVQVPRAGIQHRFEQLLVVDGGATLTANYHTKKAPKEPPNARGWLRRLSERLCARRQ